MNLVLIGYRGTGKSVVGRMAAGRLGLTYVSMDDAIVAKAGMPIPRIVETIGWPGFRDLESEQARTLAAQDGLLIDTGGGVIERPENMAALRANGLIIWLKASADVIAARIGTDTQRPALTEGGSFIGEIAEVLARRTAGYRSSAQFEIDTDTLDISRVAERVVDLWRSHKVRR